MKLSQSKLEDCPSDSYQMRILSPLAKMAHSVQWIEVQRNLLDCLIKYINVFGESLTEASWSLIWTILEESVRIIKNEITTCSSESFENGNLLSLYQKVHDTAKITSGDFLTSIPIVSLPNLIDIIAEIGEIRLPGELNIPLNSVRYLWDISDFLCSAKGGLNEVFSLWKGLLSHLARLSLDSRPDVRNSAVQTLLRTMNMNGGFLKGHSEKWKCLFEEILFTFLKDLREAAKSSKTKDSENINTTTIVIGFAHFSRDSETKQWDETESTVMTGVTTLIITHFKGILTDLPEFPHYWQHFLKTLRDYVLLKDGSVELTSVAINCLYQFCVGLKEIEIRKDGSEEYANGLWDTWASMSTNYDDKRTDCSLDSIFFTQDSLLKYFKIFYYLLDLDLGIARLEVSLKVLSGALQCLTPTDQVRDIESGTEVQKFLVNQILGELVRKGDGKVLIIKEISCWLRLTCSAPKTLASKTCETEMISMGYASIRSRQSTASSYKSGADKKDSTEKSFGLIKYTFIAMTTILLEKIPVILISWQGTDKEIFSSDCLGALIESLGKFMKLKYKCPMNTKMTPIWRTSTIVLISVLKDAFISEKSNFKDIWKIILVELEESLHSCKEMFDRSLKIESMESDEKFDCQLLDLIVDFMIPRAIKDGEDEIVEGSINLLFKVAEITKFTIDHIKIYNEDFLFPSGVKGLPVSVKEILAFSAYAAIFRLAKTEVEATEMPARVLVKLTNLLEKHLISFEKDRKIFGNDFPFPRLRDLELHKILKGLTILEATEHLSFVYDLIVKCSDFGSGGCEGAKMIVVDCRRVLLLFGRGRGSDEEEAEEEEEDDDDEEEEEDDDNEEENKILPILSLESDHEGNITEFCEEPSNQNLSRVFTKPSTPVTTIAGSSTLSNVNNNNNNNNNITSSPHRSVSEE